MYYEDDEMPPVVPEAEKKKGAKLLAAKLAEVDAALVEAEKLARKYQLEFSSPTAGLSYEYLRFNGDPREGSVGWKQSGCFLADSIKDGE